MIQKQTSLNIVDNSGVKKVKCIGVKGRFGSLGSFVKGAVQEVKHKKAKKEALRKGSLLFSIVVQTRKKLKREDGQTFKFFKNSSVLVEKDKFVGSRSLIPICNELRKYSNKKILNLAQFIL